MGERKLLTIEVDQRVGSWCLGLPIDTRVGGTLPVAVVVPENTLRDADSAEELKRVREERDQLSEELCRLQNYAHDIVKADSVERDSVPEHPGFADVQKAAENAGLRFTQHYGSDRFKVLDDWRVAVPLDITEYDARAAIKMIQALYGMMDGKQEERDTARKEAEELSAALDAEVEETKRLGRLCSSLEEDVERWFKQVESIREETYPLLDRVADAMAARDWREAVTYLENSSELPEEVRQIQESLQKSQRHNKVLQQQIKHCRDQYMELLQDTISNKRKHGGDEHPDTYYCVNDVVLQLDGTESRLKELLGVFDNEEIWVIENGESVYLEHGVLPVMERNGVPTDRGLKWLADKVGLQFMVVKKSVIVGGLRISGDEALLSANASDNQRRAMAAALREL